MPKIFIDSNALAAATSLLLRLGATEVFVFGSATKGGLRPDSDVDIAVRGLPPSVYFSAISKAADPRKSPWALHRPKRSMYSGLSTRSAGRPFNVPARSLAKS